MKGKKHRINFDIGLKLFGRLEELQEMYEGASKTEVLKDDNGRYSASLA